MKTLATVLAVGVCALTYQQMSTRPAALDPAVTTYEHLATAIIEIRATEDGLVHGILLHYEAAARKHLDAALKTRGSDRASRLESAAAQITNIANEGDKPVQAIRQRLLKAGHHHHTDAETQEDYMFVDSSEKKELLELARSVSKLGRQGSDAEIRSALRDLTSLFDRVVAAE
ncbi:MAG: hypothetical protein ACYSTY_10685 [Planctomycetota bacterium]